MRTSIKTALLSTCLVVVAYTGSAQATFPGAAGKIAFHTNRDGNSEIYTMDSGGGSIQRLTNNPAEDVTPAWNADGTKIAFVSTRNGQYEIYTMNADGSGQTRLTNNAASDVGPSWSPDGTKIWFTTNRDGPASNYEIYTMNIDGTNQTRITNNPASDGSPQVSPDGTTVLFQTNRDGNYEIYKMNPNGSSQTNVTNNGAYDELPKWGADGKGFFFDSNRDGDFNVYARLLNSSSDRRISSNTAADIAPAPAPNVVTGAFDYISVWTRNVGGDNEIYADYASDILTNNSVDDGYPDWQPIVRNYARPRGATPIFVSLVPSYKQCTSANSVGKSVNADSCVPPSPASSYLTVGTPDFNGQSAKSVGSVRMASVCNPPTPGDPPPCAGTPGDQLDGKIDVSITDVRCQGTSGGCSNGALSDYSGNLLFETNLRITDRSSGLSTPGTLKDLALSVSLPCATTADATVGSTCSAHTYLDAIFGGAAVVEGRRAIWTPTVFLVYDGGSDGVQQTRADNTLFMESGLFFP
jgi:hypothetical protein